MLFRSGEILVQSDGRGGKERGEILVQSDGTGGEERRDSASVRWYRRGGEILLQSDGTGRVQRRGSASVRWYRKAVERRDSASVRWYRRGRGETFPELSAERWGLIETLKRHFALVFSGVRRKGLWAVFQVVSGFSLLN